MNAGTIWIIIIIVIIVLFGIWYYFNASATPQTDTSTITGDSFYEKPSGSSGTSTNTSANMKEFIISSQNFSFDPSNITVNYGDRVKIIFRNISGTHDFKLDEFGVATNIITGEQEQAVEFTADKKGSFEYYCSVGNHRAMGMKGTLVVN